MSHGDHKSHKAVVDLVKEYNKLNRNCLAIMLDTKGPEVRSGDLTEPIDMKAGEHRRVTAWTYDFSAGPHALRAAVCVTSLIRLLPLQVSCTRSRLPRVQMAATAASA